RGSGSNSTTGQSPGTAPEPGASCIIFRGRDRMRLCSRPGLRAMIMVVTVIAAALSYAGAALAQQQAAVKLFKIVTAKDEVEIGLTDDELKGPASDLENLAKRLADAGQVTVWQYAVRKGADGSLEHAPLKRVAIFKTDTLRVEPFNPAPLKVVPPEKTP